MTSPYQENFAKRVEHVDVGHIEDAKTNVNVFALKKFEEGGRGSVGGRSKRSRSSGASVRSRSSSGGRSGRIGSHVGKSRTGGSRSSGGGRSRLQMRSGGIRQTGSRGGGGSSRGGGSSSRGGGSSSHMRRTRDDEQLHELRSQLARERPRNERGQFLSQEESQEM